MSTNRIPVQAGVGSGGGGGTQDVDIVASVTLNTNSVLDPTLSSINALSWYTSAGSLQGASGLVIKASAGRLYQCHGFSTNAATRYIMVFNSAIAPANGDSPVITIQVPGNGSYSLDPTIYGQYFSTGIAIAYSTSATTLVLGANEVKFHVGYL